LAEKIINQNPVRTLEKIEESSAIIFESSQWPSPAEEEWRRTNLAKFDMSGFNLGITDSDEYSSGSDEWAESDGYSLLARKSRGEQTAIIVNESYGKDILLYEPMYSTVPDGKSQDEISKLAEYAFSRMDNKTGFLALTSFRNSIFLLIPDNLSIVKPVIVEFNSYDADEVFLPNLFVSTGDDSTVKIIQKITTSGNSNVSGSLTVLSGNNSSIQTVTVIDEGDESTVFLHRNFELPENAALADFQSYSGGILIKSRTEVELTGEKADARLYGLIMSSADSHVAMRSVQRHKVKNCYSQAIVKSVVGGRGRSIYQGLIEVEEEAPLTDAYLTNHNIVLNNGARADSIPSLKIRNNDVKCSHGSTTGKIDEEQILYLTSRGLGREDARQMILEGFLGSVYDLLSKDIKNYCSPFLIDKLKQREAVH